MASAAPNDPNSLDRDLGLGGRIADEQRIRMLNRDGTFNVRRAALPGWGTEDVYHHLLTIPWWQFHWLVIGIYVATNALFATAFFLCGPGAIAGSEATSAAGRFADCFYFSVQTLVTIGYGRLTPNNTAANILVTVEALIGLMGSAFVTGILFARFSRPTARLLFSDHALISPYRQGTGLMFRLMNARPASEITEVQATVTLSWMADRDGRRVRRFEQLALERQKVMFLPMQWVVVHPIDESSPLHGWAEQDLRNGEAEILILITAVDETFAQQVHSRSSYRFDEVVWNAKFTDMNASLPGGVEVDAKRLSEFIRL